MKPTERTLKYFRDQGYVCDMVERWIRNPKHPAGGFRKDYLGFGDILGFSDTETLLIQSCGSSYSAHLKTILSLPAASQWLVCENRRLFLVAWRKLKLKRGGKAMRWKPRVAEFFLIDRNLECREEK